MCEKPLNFADASHRYKQQGSAVADKPALRAASRRTCSWTLSVINLRPS